MSKTLFSSSSPAQGQSAVLFQLHCWTWFKPNPIDLLGTFTVDQNKRILLKSEPELKTKLDQIHNLSIWHLGLTAYHSNHDLGILALTLGKKALCSRALRSVRSTALGVYCTIMTKSSITCHNCPADWIENRRNFKRQPDWGWLVLWEVGWLVATSLSLAITEAHKAHSVWNTVLKCIQTLPYLAGGRGNELLSKFYSIMPTKQKNECRWQMSW